MGRKLLKTCCVCLKTGTDFNKLTVKQEGSVMLITKFKMCVAEVMWSPSFYACPECTHTLNIVHKFREKCIEAEITRKHVDQKISDQKSDLKVDEDIKSEELSSEDPKLIKKDEDEKEDEFGPAETYSSDEDTSEDVKLHETSETKPQRRKRKSSFLCDTCPKEFPSSTKLINHCKKTHGITENIRPYTCERCPQRFLSSSTLWQHIKYHEGVKSNMCSYCGKGFITKTDLTNHEKKHLNLREYKCELCGKTFNTHKNIRTHKLIVHTDPSNWKFVCEICSKPFPIKSNYDSHMRRHTGDKKFECHLCDKKFAAKCDLQRHIKSHSDARDHRCPHCKREYKDERVLKVHMAKIHSVGLDKVKIPERTRKYACDLCPKAYFAKNKLTRHLYGHSGEKPFACAICDKKFKDKWYVKTHLKNFHNLDDADVKFEEIVKS